MYYTALSTDTTLTSANLQSALASLNDDELRSVFEGVSSLSREQRITNWIMTFYSPTWEYVAGWCFYVKKDKALEEMKKHFKRKLGMSLIERLH